MEYPEIYLFKNAKAHTTKQIMENSLLEAIKIDILETQLQMELTLYFLSLSCSFPYENFNFPINLKNPLFGHSIYYLYEGIRGCSVSVEDVYGF